MADAILMKGNDAVGEAAVIAGCRYYFAYPITPQNELAAYMARRLPDVGGTFLQAESELASINMVMGAAAAGARVMTSSSSPGISLKQEGISYLAGCKLPAVVVNMMRGGPGLGNIAGAQGDYFQATKGGGHGDYHNIVLAPSSVQELADLTVLAFELADTYRMVAMILGDGYIGQMSESVILPEPTGKSFDKSSWSITGCEGREARYIASLRLSPENGLEQIVLGLLETYRQVEAREVRFETYRCEDAEVLLVAFGLSARIAKAAVHTLRGQGVRIGLFRPITLWPFPYQALRQTAGSAKHVLVVEMNAGQMIEDVRLALGERTPTDFYGRVGGMLVEEEAIVDKVKSYA
ncbi:MAG: 3-methyl-2-oxobutanoate dehydrogenase subunit VorB [Spirochaetales bacterium]|nr:3-methyl-2-oxobutanoate dehydrogenase subunit VorB [Spirochaetales bacterium]